MTSKKWESIINYFWEQTAPKIGLNKKDWKSIDHYSGAYSCIYSDNGQLHVSCSLYRIFRIPSLYSDTKVFINASYNRGFRIYFFEEGKNLLHAERYVRK